MGSIPRSPLDVLGLFKFTKYQLVENQSNSLCVATLLNSNNWGMYVDGTLADLAIGGPTLEMLCDSWNDYFNGDALTKTRLFNGVGEKGYYVGDIENPNSTEVKLGLSGPYVTDWMNTYGSYWLASPSAEGGEYLYAVNNTSWKLVSQKYGMNNTYFRPVVTLKRGTKLKRMSNGDLEAILPSDD